jgi:hypothetical protein
MAGPVFSKLQKKHNIICFIRKTRSILLMEFSKMKIYVDQCFPKIQCNELKEPALLSCTKVRFICRI